MYEHCRPYRFIFGLLCGFVLLAYSAIVNANGYTSFHYTRGACYSTPEFVCNVIAKGFVSSGGLNFVSYTEPNCNYTWKPGATFSGDYTYPIESCYISGGGGDFGGGGACGCWGDNCDPSCKPQESDPGATNPNPPASAPETQDICSFGYCPGEINGKKVCIYCSGGGGDFGGGGASGDWGEINNGGLPQMPASGAASSPAGGGNGGGTSNPGATVPEDKPGNCEGADKDTVGCMRPGNIPQPEKVRGNDTAGNWQNGSYSTVSGCPAPRVFTAFGRVYYLRYDEVCDFGKYTKPVMLLISAIVAAYITMASFKE